MNTKPRAAVITVHPGEVSAAFAYSLVRLTVAEVGMSGLAPAVIFQRCGSGQLVEARNDCARFFLETGIEWALFVDSDMGYDADLIDRLVAAADPVTRPIVGALCFGLKRQGRDDPATQAIAFRCFPTLYRWVERETEVGWQVITDYPRGELVQVAATGAACFIVHRSALEKIHAAHGTWFDRITHPKGPTRFSEDLSFFVRVAACDLPAYVHTGIRTSHDKGGVFLTEQTWDEQQAHVKLSDAAPVDGMARQAFGDAS